MSGWFAWAVANPAAATALATRALVVVGILIGGGQIAVVRWGIRSMMRSEEALERDRWRRKMMEARARGSQEAADWRDEAIRARRAPIEPIERTAPPALAE